MSASGNLGRQFTPDEVRAHVPDHEQIEEHLPSDRFVRRLVPLEHIVEPDRPGLTLEHPPENLDAERREEFGSDFWDRDYHEDKVHEYSRRPPHTAPPLVLAMGHQHQGRQLYHRLDGYHRIWAADLQGSTHAVAYVRDRGVWHHRDPFHPQHGYVHQPEHPPPTLPPSTVRR